MSREDTCKGLLLKFYGLDSDADGKKNKKLSTSIGVENFENVKDIDEKLTENLISTEEIEETQNNGDYLDGINDEKNDTTLSKSSHVLTIDDFLTENEEDFQEPDSELDITGDALDKFTTKNVTRLEDTFTRAVAKINELPMRSDFSTIENSSDLSSASVSKAKKLWRQKTILLKENTGSSINLLSKFNGVFLDWNYMGITNFPIDLMPRLKNLQMLYLDSNNLKEIPEDFFIILQKLKWLDVRNNQLSHIPSTVKGHESLETLLLQGNNLERLPLELGSVPNLKNLQTAYNPLVFPPQEVLEKGCLSILNFLRKKWNILHEDEQIELKKVSYDTVDKRPSTIICYLQPAGKNLQRKFKYHNPDTLKSPVRTKSWNYKPTSRYGSRNCSWVLKKVENYTTISDDSIILCNFCAATLYRKGVSVASVADESCNIKDEKSANRKKQLQNTLHNHGPVIIEPNLNFLHLTGPSPRSLFIRKNFDFLVNNKQRRMKLCQIKCVNLNTQDSKIKRDLNGGKSLNMNPVTKVFDVITNDRIKMKIKPMQLNEPQLIMNFLKAILTCTNYKFVAKPNKKSFACKK